jgi:hypothetical protein
MAQGSLIYPGPPYPLPTSSAGASVVAQDITPSVAGISIVGMAYYKNAADTGTHTATVYNASTQANLGSATFTGETASGWQTVTFGTPIALTSGTAYRCAVSSPTQHYYGSSFTGPSTPSVVMSSTAYYIAGSTTAFPSSSTGNTWQGVDPLLDGLPASTARASQILDEAWTSQPSALRASQVMAEGWVQNQPPTGLRASQLLDEAWVSITPVRLVASQIIAEVWLAPPPPRLLWVSAQVV